MGRAMVARLGLGLLLLALLLPTQVRPRRPQGVGGRARGGWSPYLGHAPSYGADPRRWKATSARRILHNWPAGRARGPHFPLPRARSPLLSPAPSRSPRATQREGSAPRGARCSAHPPPPGLVWRFRPSPRVEALSSAHPGMLGADRATAYTHPLAHREPRVEPRCTGSGEAAPWTFLSRVPARLCPSPCRRLVCPGERARPQRPECSQRGHQE